MQIKVIKQGQSAIESLMTYGWMILLIVAVLVIIYSLGVFSPLNFVSAAPTTSGFTGVEVTTVVANYTYFEFYITNSLSVPINLNKFLLTYNNTKFSNISCQYLTLSPGQNSICFGKLNLAKTRDSASLGISFSISSNINASSNGTISFVPANTKLYLPSIITEFTEEGLPSGYQWWVDYAGINHSSTGTEILFASSASYHSFIVSNLTINGCTFSALPASGTLEAGRLENIIFLNSCAATFIEKELPTGTEWKVTYAGVTNSSTTNLLLFTNEKSGTYTFSVNNVIVQGCTYTPSPSSGSLAVGGYQYIRFLGQCITTFKETGLPINYGWSVTYEKITKTNTTSNIYYFGAPGNFSYSIATLSNSSSSPDCTTTYTPSPSSGSAEAGTTTSISFSASTTCTTTFDESNLPSGYTWTVDYNSVSKSSSTSSISFSNSFSGVTPPTYSYSVTTLSNSTLGCTTTYTPSPSSGSAEAGTTTSISFSASTTCTTTFDESNLPSGYTWDVTYDGTTSSETAPSSISFPNTVSGSSIPTYSYSVTTLSNSTLGCTTTYTPSPSSGSAEAGTTTSISFSASTTCTTTFDESNLPSGYTWTVDYDSATKSATTPSSIPFSTTFQGSDYSLSYTASATADISNGGVCTASASVTLGETYTFTNWVCEFPFIIENTQSVSTSAPFQEEATISLSDFSGYAASNLQNAEFFYSNGTVIPSWLAEYSSSSATWFLKIGGGIPANSELNIELGFALPTSTVLFNNVNDGEAPTLSSTYGEYDNGANVFNLYSNFAGTSLPSGFTEYVSSGSSISISNGITFNLGDSVDPSYAFILDSSEHPDSVADAEVTSLPVTQDETHLFQGFTSSPIGNGISNYVGISFAATCGDVDHGFTLSNVSSISSTSATLSAPAILSSSNSFVSGYENYSRVLTSTQNAISSDTYPVLGTQSVGSGSGCVDTETTSYKWYAVRSEPPNGVMPIMFEKPVLPSGIIDYAPVVITNNQSSATAAPFQQEIVVNSNDFSSYEASNLQNVEFFNSNGQIIPSWLELGNSTYGSTVYWLKLSSGIPASSSEIVYIGFASTSTNLFNSNNVGEAPTLSSTYGEYDDGPNVFNYYTNFNGTSLPNSFEAYNEPSYISVDNGVTLSQDSGNPAIEYTSDIAPDTTAVMTGEKIYDPNGGEKMFSYDPQFGYVQDGESDGGLGNRLGTQYNIGIVTSKNTDVPSVYTNMPISTSSSVSAAPLDTSVIWLSTSNLIYVLSSVNNVLYQESTTDLSTSSEEFYYETGGTNSPKITVYYSALLAVPPNGVMPGSYIGSVLS
jgi:hypothetical protein